MRLLFVSHSLPPEGRPMDNVGGMQRVAIDLHDSLLANKGVTLRALVLRSPWDQRGFRTPLFLARALREIRMLARQREIDAVLFSSMVTAALAVPLRNVLRRNKVVTAAIANGLDATTPTWPYPTLVRRTFEAVDVVLPISNATAAACRERGLPPDKCRVNLLGIRLDRFSSMGDRDAARSHILALARSDMDARLVLCSVGRLVPRKGVDWFVGNVMPLLPPDVRYLVAGEGPERLRIEQTIARVGLASRVSLLGAISDEQLEMLYRGSDLFVMPNVPVAGDMEGFGLVMLEAGLCGLPTIAARLEGIADVITDAENGNLVQSGDANGFRDVILEYYHDHAMLNAASTRARLHTESRFGWAGVTERYIELIRGLVQRRQSEAA